MGGVFQKKLSRKEFLKFAGIGLMAVLIAKPFLSLFSKEAERPEKVENSYGNGPYGGVRR